MWEGGRERENKFNCGCVRERKRPMFRCAWEKGGEKNMKIVVVTAFIWECNCLGFLVNVCQEHLWYECMSDRNERKSVKREKV